MPRLITEYADEPASGSEATITDEAHTVGEDVSNLVWLHRIPLEESPSTVTVTEVGVGDMTEVTGTPADGEFKVHYSGRQTGVIEFNAADDGIDVQVDYKGRGSPVAARDWLRMIEKMQGVKSFTDSGGTVSIDFVDEWNALIHPLDGNHTIQVADLADLPPEGVVVTLTIHQDGTGSRAPTFATASFDFGADGAPTLTTDADKYDVLSFRSNGPSKKLAFVGIAKGFTDA